MHLAPLDRPSSGPATYDARAVMTAAQTPRRVNSSAVVFAASLVGHAGNFALFIVTYRVLGDAGWSTVASLTALGLIVTLPASGVQAHLAALLAAATTQHQRIRARRQATKVVQAICGVALALLVLAVFATQWATDLWRLTTAQWLVAALWVVLTGLLQVTLGALQGLQRFGALGVQLALPFGALRPVLAVMALAFVARSALGVLGALLVCSVAGLVVSVVGAQGGYAQTAAADPHEQSPEPPQLVSLPAAVAGLLGVSVLINGDVALAKVLLPDDEASTFAAAALIGKIAFHAPAALAFVLLPTVTGLAARGQAYRATYGRALGVAVTTGLCASTVFALLPGSIWTWVMGDGFLSAVPLVPLVALVSTAVVVLYLQLQVDLAVAPHRVWWRWVPLGLTTLLSLLLLGHTASSLVMAVAVVVLPCTLLFVGWEFARTSRS